MTGTGHLLRLYARTVRRAVLLWVAGFAMLVPLSAIAIKEAYPDAAALEARAQLLDNPAAVMMTGPMFAQDEYTLWAMIGNELALYLYLAAAIMGILLMVRLTRAEEEAGRTEMVRALPVGRHAPSLAALIIVGFACLLVGAATGGGLILGGGAVADSLAMGLATAVTGTVFAGVAFVAAQITEHAGTASGTALGALGIAFMVRGIGDVIDRQGSWLSWFSPLAWAQQTRAYVDLRWWPLLLSAALTIGLLAVALVLAHRRDLGAGLRSVRGGRAQASSSLVAVPGLAHRLLRGTMVSWAVGLALFAVAFGALATTLEDMIVEMPMVQDWIPLDMDDLVDSFVAIVLTYLAIGPAALLVGAVMRLRTEETAGRLSGMLLAGRSRVRLAAGWLLASTVWCLAIQALMGVATGAGVWTATRQPAAIAEVTGASLAYVPAILLFGGIAVAPYGLSPRLAPLAWAVVVWAAIVAFLGGLLDLPELLLGISPLHHVPLLPSEELEIVPLVVMTLLALLLVAVGLWGLRRRDLAGG